MLAHEEVINAIFIEFLSNIDLQEPMNMIYKDSSVHAGPIHCHLLASFILQNERKWLKEYQTSTIKCMHSNLHTFGCLEHDDFALGFGAPHIFCGQVIHAYTSQPPNIN